MPLCSFSESYLLLGVTPVENIFIQDYLPHAPGDYVRVYLYGLMQCYHPTEDITPARMAHLLDLTEDTVQAAFQYWERQGLVQRVSDNPPSYQYLNLTAAVTSESPMEKAVYKHRDFNTKMQQLFGTRLLHPAEFMTACEWVEDLHLPEEVVLIMVEHFIAGKGRSFQFRQLNKTALQWAEKGINTVQAANDMIMRDTSAYKMAEKVIRRFNLRRAPTLEEVALARKWLEEYGMDESAVLVACRETVKGRNPSFGYLDGILSRNHTARSSEDMAGRLEEKKRQEDAVKAIHDALGIRQMAPTPGEVEAYQNYMAAGFEPGAVLRVARGMGSTGRYDMEDLDRQMARFVELGLLTEAEIAAHMDQQKALREQAARIYEVSGQPTRVTAASIAQLEEWLEMEPLSVILFAAECARGTKLPVQYITKLLREWKKAGIDSVEGARRQHEALQASGGAPKSVPASMQYDQRTYSAEELSALTAFMEDDHDAK